MAQSLLRAGRINPQRAQAVLSVSTETAVYSQQAFHRTRGTSDQGNAPTAGFSSLVDSNTEAATSSRDDGPRQPSNHTATGRGDDTSSAPAADVGHAKGKAQTGRGDAKAAAGTDNKNNPNPAGANGQQQEASTVAVADVAISADASAVVTQTTVPDATAQATPGQDSGKDKTATKTDGAGDVSSAGATQPNPVDQATTLVVAVVAQVVAPNATTPTTPAADTGPAAVTAVSSAPGAIAAAAASKVAADVAATQPTTATAQAQPEATGVQGQSTDAKTVATDQAQAIVAPQQATSQSTDQTTAQTVTVATLPAQGDAAALAQAVVATQTAAPVKTDAPAPTSAKAKTTALATDAKATIDKNEPSVIDPQATKVVATDETKAADPIAPKKAATTVQARDTSDPSETKAQTDADAPAVVPTVHQHAAAEARITPPSPLGATDLSNANAAQVAAANAQTTPAPATTAVLNTANLTVITGQSVPLSGLAVEISANAKAGNSRFEIRLDPPDLGRIDVRLDVDKNGQVTSRLFVEKSETLDLLRRDAPQLQQALQDAGLKTSDSGLQFSLRDQNPQQGQNSGNNSGNGQNPQRLIIAEDDTATASAAGRSYGRSLSASGGVDIRV